MANKADDILKKIKDEEIEWIDLRFTDPKGKNRGGRGGDHPLPSADESDDHGNRKGGIESDAGIDPCDDRKADRFGNEGKRDDDAGKHVGAHVGEPVASDRGEVEHDDFSVLNGASPARRWKAAAIKSRTDGGAMRGLSRG